MAKKTNKTNHVLNLLSGAEEQETQDTAAPKETEPKVRIVTPNEEDAVAADVQQLLEEELLQEEMALKEQEEKEQQMEEELAAEEEAETTDETESAADAGLSDVLPAIEETEPEPQEEPESSAEADTEPEPQEEPKPVTEAAAAPDSKQEEPETPPYVLVNVMESIVDDKIDYYMDKFNVCHCARCRADVKALALTHMEPKYVVVDKSGISAFLSLYTNKFSSEVLFHLGQACMQVLENPRH